MTIRPTINDEAVRIVAVASKLDDIVRLIEEDADDAAKAEIQAQVVEACQYETDGYEIMKNLDNDHGWTGSAGLVDELDSLSHALHVAKQEAVKAWVKENNIQPAFKKGDRIKAKHGHKKITGAIHEIKAETAEYTILDDNQHPSIKPIVFFENTEAEGAEAKDSGTTQPR